MKNCPNTQENKEDCACQEFDCERHGTCCECIRYHRERNQKPACLR